MTLYYRRNYKARWNIDWVTVTTLLGILYLLSDFAN
jgi:hypothetical protein